jgi:hypothetical protein
MPTTNPAVRSLLGALPMLAAGSLLIAGALTPSGLDQPIRSLDTARSQLSIASAQSERLYLCATLIIFGLGCLAAAFPAIGTLGGTRPTAVVAAVIAGLACTSGVVVNTLVNLNVAGATRANASQETAAQIVFTVNTTAVATGFLITYAGGLIAASILLGVALWRAKSVPHWLAAAFPLVLILAALAPPGPLGAALAVPFTAVMILLGTRLWRRPVSDTGPSDHTRPDPATLGIPG